MQTDRAATSLRIMATLLIEHVEVELVPYIDPRFIYSSHFVAVKYSSGYWEKSCEFKPSHKTVDLYVIPKKCAWAMVAQKWRELKTMSDLSEGPL